MCNATDFQLEKMAKKRIYATDFQKSHATNFQPNATDFQLGLFLEALKIGRKMGVEKWVSKNAKFGNLLHCGWKFVALFFEKSAASPVFMRVCGVSKVKLQFF